jgi:hypothetical protein
LDDHSPFCDHSSFRALPSSVAQGVGRARRETKDGCDDEQKVFADAPPAVECTPPILREICSCDRCLQERCAGGGVRAICNASYCCSRQYAVFTTMLLPTTICAETCGD